MIQIPGERPLIRRPLDGRMAADREGDRHRPVPHPAEGEREGEHRNGSPTAS